jgi:hypothetical protein
LADQQFSWSGIARTLRDHHVIFFCPLGVPPGWLTVFEDPEETLWFSYMRLSKPHHPLEFESFSIARNWWKLACVRSSRTVLSYWVHATGTDKIFS